MNVAEPSSASIATIVGRYALFDEIASGGMAAVHYGRLLGPSGFSRTVAIKRLHPHLAKDAEFAAMFLDEARVAARVRHPNVVPTLDIISEGNQLFLVMEYVQGESLARMLRAAKRAESPMPPSVAAAIIVGVLHGLHAAHEAVNEKGEPLGIVHRDVSPQNILVGLDGIPRLVDFGVAKAIGRVQQTREGQLKGKIAYMAPEQIRGANPTRLVDVYAASIVLWEMLTGERLFGGENDVTVLERALHHDPEAPSTRNKEVTTAFDEVVLKGLSRDPSSRYTTAREMARAIESATPIASVSKVGEWVESIAGEAIAERAAKVAEIESVSQVRTLKSHPSLMLDPPSGPTVSPFDVPVSTSDVPPPFADKRRVAMLAAIGALVVVALVATAIALRTSRSNEAAANVAPTTHATETATQPNPPDPIPTPVVVPTPTATIPVAATATVTATAVAATTTVKPVATVHQQIVRDFPTTKPGTKPGCSPPYTIDANGVKQYKVECL